MRKGAKERMGSILCSKNGETEESHRAVPREWEGWGQGTFITTLHLHIIGRYALCSGPYSPKYLENPCIPMKNCCRHLDSTSEVLPGMPLSCPARSQHFWAPGFWDPVLIPQLSFGWVSQPLANSTALGFCLGFGLYTGASKVWFLEFLAGFKDSIPAFAPRARQLTHQHNFLSQST